MGIQVIVLILQIKGLVPRLDGKYINRKVNQVNQEIEQLCDNNDWDFISHPNITDDCFDEQSIDLNRKGTRQFASDIIIT